MPWEMRGGRRYYYRKERRGGRVFSVYEGGGLGGTLAAQRDAAERETRAKSCAELCRELQRQDAIDAKVEASWKVAERAARAVLEAAVLCWLRLALMELRYSAVTAASNALTSVEHTERRLTEAQKRFNRACEALAKVRKLARPKVQINVAAEGGQQVNVA